jgi:hypothetical protein
MEIHRLAVAVDEAATVVASSARGIINPVAVNALILVAARRVKQPGGCGNREITMQLPARTPSISRP